MWRWGLIAFCLLCACREPEDTYRGLRGARFADPSGALMYRFYVPPDASPEHRLPLVLYLGSQRGYDNEQHVDYRVTRWVENQLQHPCFVLAPQLPRGAWVAADPTKGSYTFDEAKLTEPMQLVIELLELFMKRYPLDLTRIYVVGDYGAWELLMRKPHWFAAAIVIEGGSDPKQATRVAGIPIWVFHGAKDHTVPVAAAREMIQALKAIGSSPRYTEYPDVDHESAPRAFTPELDTWLFEQHRAAR